MKSDSKTIQAIHDAVITHNRRVSISGDLSTTFNLLIAQVEEKDRGEYMCQINTDPMTYQAGHTPFAVQSCEWNELNTHTVAVHSLLTHNNNCPQY